MWCIIICLFFIVLSVLFIVLENQSYNYDYEIPAFIFGTLAAIMMILIIAGFPLSQIGYQSEIKQFHAFEQTVIEARANPLSDYELAAIMQKTAEWNEWLANAQYQNQLWDWFIPDEVNDLKPLK